MRINVIGLRGFPGIQGGVEKHCEELYPRMDACRFRVFRRKPYLTKDSVSRVYNNIEFKDLPSTRLKGFEALFHTFLCAVCCICRKPDLVHVHNIGPGLMIPLLKIFGLKVVMTYHSANYEHKKWGPVGRALLRLGEKCSLGLADRVIFVNSAQMSKYSECVLSKSTWIANGVKREPRTEDNSCLKELGIADTPYILAVGRLTPEKGFEYLVEAVNKEPRIERLVIVGGSDHNTDYLDRLKRLDVGGKVIFTGNLVGDPLCQLYSHACLFVLSSVNEGFPLVVLEAMNYGLPLIVSRISATDIPQIPECRKFAPADATALAEKISEVYTSEPEIQHYNLSDYDWDAIALQTLDVYRQAANKG